MGSTGQLLFQKTEIPTHCTANTVRAPALEQTDRALALIYSISLIFPTFSLLAILSLPRKGLNFCQRPTSVSSCQKATRISVRPLITCGFFNVPGIQAFLDARGSSPTNYGETAEPDMSPHLYCSHQTFQWKFSYLLI